jgi:thiol:disulfide interchange protein DsbC
MNFLWIQILFVLLLFVSPASTASEVSNRVIGQLKSVFGKNNSIAIEVYRASKTEQSIANDTGLLEISIGAKTYFASRDGRFIFAGPILDTYTRENIVELKARQYRVQKLAQLPDDMQLNFPAVSDTLHTVTVFTDIDCKFCRRFHSLMEEFNKLGVSVKYVMLPRAGINSDSYRKSVAVLCSKQPQANMTLAMKDEFNGAQTCDHSVQQQMMLAQELGIDSTPTLLLPNGQLHVGLVKPAQLFEILK